MHPKNISNKPLDDMVYSITADTCELRPKIRFEYEHLTDRQMRKCVKILIAAFRQVKVTNCQTGEVILTHYESDEIFAPTATPTEAIDNCMMFIADC